MRQPSTISPLLIIWPRSSETSFQQVSYLGAIEFHLLCVFCPPSCLYNFKMSLSEEHTACIVEYLRFQRYKRSQRVRGVDVNFQELKESRLRSSLVEPHCLDSWKAHILRRKSRQCLMGYALLCEEIWKQSWLIAHIAVWSCSDRYAVTHKYE